MNYRRVALIFTLTIMVIMLALPFVVRADEPATAPAAAAAPAVTDALTLGGPPLALSRTSPPGRPGKPTLVELLTRWATTKSPSTLPGP